MQAGMQLYFTNAKAAASIAHLIAVFKVIRIYIFSSHTSFPIFLSS